MPISVRRALPLALASLLAAGPAGAQNIDTGTPPPAPNWPIFPFGRPSDVQYASLGQSFTAPTGANTQLTGFQFWTRAQAGAAGVPFYAYVFAWDPATRRTGAEYLFRSAAQTVAAPTTPTAVSFVTGGLTLSAGQTYLAVLSSAEFPAAPSDGFGGLVVSSAWPNDGYAGGAAFIRFSAASAGIAGLAAGPWATAGGVTTGGDFAFTATFGPTAPSVVPEPATVVLVGVGALGVAVVARRRRG